MNRRILFLLSICFIFCASCASQPKSAPRAEYAQDEPAQVERAQPAQNTVPQHSPSEAPPTNQQGPIDLGLGGDDPNGAAIVINRPDNAHTDLDDVDTQDEESSKTYERMCEEIEHCEGLEELDCEGEMACVESRCVYTCDSDELDDDEFDETDA